MWRELLTAESWVWTKEALGLNLLDSYWDSEILSKGTKEQIQLIGRRTPSTEVTTVLKMTVLTVAGPHDGRGLGR